MRPVEPLRLARLAPCCLVRCSRDAWSTIRVRGMRCARACDRVPGRRCAATGAAPLIGAGEGFLGPDDLMIGVVQRLGLGRVWACGRESCGSLLELLSQKHLSSGLRSRAMGAA